MSNNKEKVIDILAKEARQSYTPEELELIKEGIRIGASNHTDILRKDKEWYEQRNKRWKDGEKGRMAMIEFAKNLVFPKDARHLTYEEVRDEVLTKLMNALADNEQLCDKYFEQIKHLRELNKQLK